MSVGQCENAIITMQINIFFPSGSNSSARTLSARATAQIRENKHKFTHAKLDPK